VRARERPRMRRWPVSGGRANSWTVRGRVLTQRLAVAHPDDDTRDRISVVLAPAEAVTRVHARLWATLAGRGVNLGAHDLIIGATAVAFGWSVATRDTRSFPKIPDLEVEVWK
jgi:predicted nucleic acid-binding protein